MVASIQSGRFDHLGHEVQGQRLVGVDLTAAEGQLHQGHGTAHQIMEGPVHDVAERAFGVGEARRARRHPQVAQHGQVEAAGDGGPVHRRHGGGREVQDAAVVAVARRPQPAGERRVGGRLVELAQIEAGTEHVAGAGDDDGLARRRRRPARRARRRWRRVAPRTGRCGARGGSR